MNGFDRDIAFHTATHSIHGLLADFLNVERLNLMHKINTVKFRIVKELKRTIYTMKHDGKMNGEKVYQVTNTSLPCRIMFVRSLEQSLVGTCVVDCNNFFCSRFSAVFSHPMSIGFCLFELVSQLRPTKMRYRLFETFATATAHDLCVLGRILNEKFDRVHYTTTSALY